MERIVFRLYQAKASLRGTLYVEFQPGAHGGKHRQPGSRYIYEPTFHWLIEKVFRQRIDNYNTYGPNVISRVQWGPILEDLADLRLRTSRQALKPLLLQLETWLHRTLKRREFISVLGV